MNEIEELLEKSRQGKKFDDIEKNTREVASIQDDITTDRELMLEYLDMIEDNTKDFKQLQPSSLALGEEFTSEFEQLNTTFGKFNNLMSKSLESRELTVQGPSPVVINQQGEEIEKDTRVLGELEKQTFEIDETNDILSRILSVEENRLRHEELERDRFKPTLPESEPEEERDPEAGGMFDFLGSFLKGFKGLGGLPKMLMKGAGVVGIIASAGMFAKGMYDAFTNEDRMREIIGRADGALTAAEESAAGFSAGIEKMSFGLLEAEKVFKFSQPVFEKIQGLVDLLNVHVIEPVIDAIMDFDFTEAKEKLFQGFRDLFSLVTDSVKDIGSTIARGAGSLIGGLFGFGSSDEPEAQRARVVSRDDSEMIRRDRNTSRGELIDASSINRRTRSESIDLSKKRFEERERRERENQQQPVVNNVTNNNNSAIIQQNELGKQLQILGI